VPSVTATEASLRAAFAEGISDTSAALMLRARDDGLDWETLTRAVAAGLEDRYRPANPTPAAQQRRRSGLGALVGGMAVYALLRPLLGLGHELTVAGFAWMLHFAVGSGIWVPLICGLGLDPIYAGAAMRAAGGVQVDGFAVANPLGGILHTALPALFLAPDRVADGAGISMVATSGAPVLGRSLAAFGADVIWLAIGLWLFWGWRRHNWKVALLGMLIQAQIAVNHLLDAEVGITDVNASGIPFAIALALPNGGWLTTGLGGLSTEVRDLVIGGGLIVLGYAGATFLVLVGLRVGRIGRSFRRDQLCLAIAKPPRTRVSMLLMSVGLALGTALSPIGGLAVGESNWQVAMLPTLSMRKLSQVSRSGARHSRTQRLAGATPVEIRQAADGGWQYLVDGQPETIRGVGYNPQYAALGPAERTTLYQRDFADMHRLGINTIEGWFEGQFDTVTLDNAARNGVGVLMPFELNQAWDYTDPAVRASILGRVSAHVEQYKHHPAVRMWTPGNENLHRILYSRWVSQANVPAARAKADAFAAFLPVLVDRIHELDPAHPVVYRDAEDVYLRWVTNAFAQDGRQRPWLVYGANVYSATRLQEIVAEWPSQWPGRPLLISEFAPVGMSPAERPLGFQQQWAVIRARPDVVLGGLAYTWATNGPEDLDRVFGLVDPNGVPTDGALEALSMAYLADAGVLADGRTLAQ
jgi:Glycosyl hydrolases family 2, TIM barrel domain